LLHGADFAKGSRFAPGGGSGDITRLRSVGNRVLNGLVNLSFGTRYTDLCYGFNAFWRTCLPHISLEAGEHQSTTRWGDGFEVETLINIRVARAGLRVFEVPSYERPRLHGASNLRAFSDGLRVLRTVAIERRLGTARVDPGSSPTSASTMIPNVIHIDGSPRAYGGEQIHLDPAHRFAEVAGGTHDLEGVS
jgi:hypothetical protein